MTETVELGNPNLCVTTTYVYDSFGNKFSATTANYGGQASTSTFTSRTSASAFTAQTTVVDGVTVAVPAGSFPTTVTNALSQSETKAFDPRFGIPLDVAVARLEDRNF